LAGLFAFLILPEIAWAQTLPLVTAKGTGANTVYAVPVETLLALTALSFFACCTDLVNELYTDSNCLLALKAGLGANHHATQYSFNWIVILSDTLHYESSF